MLKMQLEELESRLLLTGFGLSPGFLPPQLAPTSAVQPSGGWQGGHVFLAPPGGGGGEAELAQAPLATSLGAGFRDNNNPGAWGLSGWPMGGVNYNAEPTLIVVITNVSVEPIAARGPASAFAAAPVEHTQPTSFSEETSAPPLGFGMVFPAAVTLVPAPALFSHPGPSPATAADLEAAITYNANGLQPHSLSSFQAHSLSSDPAAPNGVQVQGRQLPPSPAPAVDTTPPLVELRSLDQDAAVPRLLVPLELGPLDRPEASLPPPDLSGLESGFMQFLAGLGPQGQQVVAFPAPDLSALEAGLMQFLAGLSQASSELVDNQDGAVLRMWIIAAAGAGAACALAYRQQRRAAVIPQLPGCFLDEDL